MSKERKPYYKHTLIFGIVGLLITLLIIVESCLPGPISAGQSEWAADIIGSFIHMPTSQEFVMNIRKIIGHMGLFFIEGISVTLFFLYLFKYKDNFKFQKFIIYSILVGLVVAILSEVVQIFIPGRFFSLFDILIDIGGFILAFIIILVVLVVKKNKHKKECVQS